MNTQTVWKDKANGELKSYKKLRQALLRGANPNEPSMCSDRDPPVLRATSDGECNSVKLLLKYKANPNTTNTTGVTPLMVCAANLENGVKPEMLDIARMMLASGGDPNLATREQGYTAMHFTRSHVLATLLGEHGANLTARNTDYETPYEVLKKIVERAIACHGEDNVLSIVQEIIPSLPIFKAAYDKEALQDALLNAGFAKKKIRRAM